MARLIARTYIHTHYQYATLLWWFVTVLDTSLNRLRPVARTDRKNQQKWISTKRYGYHCLFKGCDCNNKQNGGWEEGKFNEIHIVRVESKKNCQNDVKSIKNSRNNEKLGKMDTNSPRPTTKLCQNKEKSPKQMWTWRKKCIILTTWKKILPLKETLQRIEQWEQKLT